MAYRVTLTFMVETTEDEAWDIAEKLEAAAIGRNYREVSGYVNELDARGRVLSGTEGSPGSPTSAVTLQRRTGEAMGFGAGDGEMITLGGERGESG